MTIVGFGIVPTPEQIVVMYGGERYTSDAMAAVESTWAFSNSLRVSTVLNDTLVTFYVPDRSGSEHSRKAIEISSMVSTSRTTVFYSHTSRSTTWSKSIPCRSRSMDLSMAEPHCTSLERASSMLLCNRMSMRKFVWPSREPLLGPY